METLFHLTDGDPDAWRVAFRSVETLHQDPEIDPQPVVVSATAVYAVVAHAPVADEVRELLTDGVEFLACSNALGKRGIDPEDLVAGVDLVESGVGALTRHQVDGAAYVKVP